MASPKQRSESPAAETHPDAWERFERAVDIVARSPPQHKVKERKSPIDPAEDSSRK
jgi:hypothetical protein